MSVLATIEVQADAFVLGEALRENPGIRVRLERVIPIGSTLVPYFWAADDSLAAIEAALERDDDVDSFEMLESVGGEALVRAEWTEGVDGFLDALAESGGAIQTGVGRANTWTFTLRFPGQDDLSAFYRTCVDRDIRVGIETVHTQDAPEPLPLGLDVTDRQRDALQTAFEEGYFDVPRRTNLTELADELGISDTAASQRLRRGIASLLNATLARADRRMETAPASDTEDE